MFCSIYVSAWKEGSKMRSWGRSWMTSRQSGACSIES